jgi:UDP-glucuronate 4-epimerase
LIYASSSSVYGLNKKAPFNEKDRADNPASLYGATKKMNEQMAFTYAHLFNVHSSGLRFFTVYGEWGRPDMALFIFTKKILLGEPIYLFNNGNMKRDFTFVIDIAKGVVNLLEKVPSDNQLAEIYNIGNNNPICLHTIIKTLEQELGKKAKIEYLPMQAGDISETWADISKLKNAIGFYPNTDISVGIKKFVKWYIRYYKI